MAAALVMTLRPAPLLTVLATAAILALAFRTAPFGIPLALMLLAWTAKHSIATLHALAGGARTVPVLSLEMILGSLDGWRSFLIMLVLVGLLFATGAAAFWLAPAIAFAVAVVAVLVLPPALLALGWTNSVAAAFDPRAWNHFARALGTDFWVLVVACAIVAAGTTAVIGAADTHWVARIAAACFGWLVLVCLCGTTIHARRDALDAITQFYRGRDLQRSSVDVARAWQEQADGIYALWRSGARADAWQRIEACVGTEPRPDEALRRLYDRARTWDATPLASRMAQWLVELDLAAGRSGYALKLARQRLALDPAFGFRDARQVLELAGLAASSSDWSTVRALMARFDPQAADEATRASAARIMAQLGTRGR